MNFLENIDRNKLQNILLIAIAALTVVFLALLLVAIIISINPSGLSGADIDLESKTLAEKDVSAGALILADEEHPFEAAGEFEAGMTNCQLYRNNNRGEVTDGPYYSMGSVQLSQLSIGAAHELLTAAEKAIGEKDLLIKSAYYENDGVTEEYNTGMLMLLTNYEEEKLPSSYATWIDKNAVKYGFVESFDDAYRYVGVAHAKYMTDEKLNLEQYIEYLKGNTSYDKFLNIKVDDQQYSVYYVTAKAGDEIKVPAENEGEYTISGTNEGGVIITLKKSK